MTQPNILKIYVQELIRSSTLWSASFTEYKLQVKANGENLRHDHMRMPKIFYVTKDNNLGAD